MPKATGLQFYRKRQSLDCLALERPQNLAAVYDIVKDSIQGIEMRLQMLITSFYGQGKTVENEVKRYLPSIESVIKPARYSSLVSRSQIEDISARHNDSTDKLRLDLQCFAVLQDCIVKTISTLRLGFADLINVVDKLLIYMRKYLLSFSSVEGDSYMETAVNYEKQRRELEVAIRQSTKNITDMADNFDGEGLTIDMMDFEVKHIAERCDCLHASLLVAFPQACNDMRRACKGLSAWLEADEYYTTYLQYDIDNLEKKRETQAKKSRDLQLKTCNVEYRLKSVKKDYDEYNEELSRLEQKEQALVNDESLLQVAHHDVNFDLEIKEYRMAEMRRHVHKNTSREFHESYERLQREINVLKEKKPTIDRKLEDIRKKTSWIRDKRERGREKLDQLEKLKSELKLCKKAARRAEVELQRLDGCLVRLKDIHRMKSCPEVLKKIFHNLPFTPRPSHSRKKTGKVQINHWKCSIDDT